MSEDLSYRVRWFHARDGVWRNLRAHGPRASEAIEAQVERFDRHGIPHEGIEVLFGPEPTPLDALRRALEDGLGEV